MKRPGRPTVVVMTTGSPNGFVRRVFESGADDILTLPEPTERIAFALEKAVARRRGAAVASGIALAPMICVLGPKGGTGKTLVSTNLSVALALAGHRVALVDLDLQFGDIGLALGLRPDKTIYDLARSGGSLDSEKLDAYLVRHESGLNVLLAPTRPDQASAVTVDFLRDVFTTLRSMWDYVIVDTPPGFTPEVIAAIDAVVRRLHRRHARLALAQEHEARARDAGADGLQPRPDHPGLEPRRHASRDHARRRRRDHRPLARDVDPERPADSDLGERRRRRS